MIKAFLQMWSHMKDLLLQRAYLHAYTWLVSDAAPNFLRKHLYQDRKCRRLNSRSY